MSLRVLRRNTAGLIWALAALAVSSRDIAGQTAEDLALTCANAGGQAAFCAAASVTARSLYGHVGLLGGMGSEVPGTASNLGTRIGGGPRLAISAGFGAVGVGFPDLGVGNGAGETTFLAPALYTGVTWGLFEGLRLMPTVGGFLSVDLIGRASFLFLPQSEGFEGSARSYSVGARVGVFREGFTIPGVSVSVTRRFLDEVVFGDAAGNAEVTLDPGVTSLRATVGKHLFVVEVLAGVGWDEYTGRTMIRVADGLGGLATANGDMTASRFLYFGSAAMTFGIILSVSVEAGWAEGFDPLAGYVGVYDPTQGTPFGSLSFRLTL